MQKWLIGAVMALGFANSSFAQGDYDTKVRAYIDKYKDLAVAEQRRSGVPACITLAQGIHETQAGNSELATLANNHFGIKCKKEWTGETFAHTDDAPNECFRKYGRSEDSYKDHSDYLSKSPRYATLFKLSITDYPSWALGLKKCGYATNPRYAQVLIKLVEDYHLQEFTYAALDNAEIIPEKDPVMVPPVKSKPTTAITPPPAAALVEKAVEAPITKTIQVADVPVTPVKEPEVIKTEVAAAVPVTPPVSTPVVAEPVAVVTPPVAAPVAAAPQPVAATLPPTVPAPAAVEIKVAETPAEPVAQPQVEKIVTAPPVIPPVEQVVTPPITPPAERVVATPPPAPQQEEPRQRPLYGKEVKVNGLKAIYGRRGETPLGYAYNAGIRYSKLLDINEIDERPLPVDMYLYLERKNTTGTKETHTVRAGETLFMVAQEEGMQIKSLMEFNLLEQGEEPLPGTVLQLQSNASEKPALSYAKKDAPPTRIKTNATHVPIVTPAPAPKPVAVAAAPAVKTSTRNKNFKVSDDIPTQPQAEVAAIKETEAPQRMVKTIPAAAPEPVAVATPVPVAAPVQVIEKPAAPVAAIDPTKEEMGREFPKQTESRYTIQDEVKSDAPEMASSPQPATPVVPEVPKPEPVKELPMTAAPEPMATTPVRQKTNNIVTESPKPVNVPTISEEPQDDIDRLKRKFDKVVYADANKGAVANPIMPVGAPVGPKPEIVPVTAPVAPAAAKPVAPPVVIDPKDEHKYYTVKKGDTGFIIARKNNITLTQLMKWNNLDFGHIDIKEGQKLKVKQ